MSCHMTPGLLVTSENDNRQTHIQNSCFIDEGSARYAMRFKVERSGNVSKEIDAYSMYRCTKTIGK